MGSSLILSGYRKPDIDGYFADIKRFYTDQIARRDTNFLTKHLPLGEREQLNPDNITDASEEELGQVCITIKQDRVL